MEVLAITGEVVVAGGGTKRHRSRAGAAVLADGSLFVAYRVGRNMFEESHGAVVATRSADGGDTWEEPAPLLAEPSWDWFGAQRLLQLDDGMLLMLAGKARWNSDRFHTYAVRSSDGGRTWDPPGPEIRVFASFSEPYGQGACAGCRRAACCWDSRAATRRESPIWPQSHSPATAAPPGRSACC